MTIPLPTTITSADQLYDHMRDYYEVLDSRIGEYIDHEKLAVACHKGCGICCHIKLDVNAHEILYLAQYINNELSPEMRDRVIIDLKKSADAIAPLSTRDHFLGRYKCGFLQNNSCSVHPARPSMCRKFNSVSFEGCQQIFSTDGKAPPQGPEDKGLNDLATDIIRTFDLNFSTAGYDATVYEINQAVLITLEEAGCMERWLAREKMLPVQVEAKKFSPAIQIEIKSRQ